MLICPSFINVIYSLRNVSLLRSNVLVFEQAFLFHLIQIKQLNLPSLLKSLVC